MAEFKQIKIDDIFDNPWQVRKTFNEDTIDELAQSYVAGQPIEPIIVYPYTDKYCIIAGERRWRAAKKLGINKIVCLVYEEYKNIEPNSPKITKLSVIENIQHEEINPVDMGTFISDYRKETGKSIEALAKEWGKKPSWIYKYESLTRLTPVIMTDVKSGIINMTLGFILAQIEDESRQELTYQALKKYKIFNTNQVQKIVSAINAAPKENIEDIVKRSRYPERVERESKKPIESKTEALIERIVSFYEFLNDINPKEIPSNKRERIEVELNSVTKRSISRAQSVVYYTLLKFCQ